MADKNKTGKYRKTILATWLHYIQPEHFLAAALPAQPNVDDRDSETAATAASVASAALDSESAQAQAYIFAYGNPKYF